MFSWPESVSPLGLLGGSKGLRLFEALDHNLRGEPESGKDFFI
jgi:hypothetical protein